MRRWTNRTGLVWLLAVLCFSITPSFVQGQERAVTFEHHFLHPPDSARPWVYWFWLNGNISSNGITADLEAMKRAGIGGVLIMEVDQGAPVGPVDFMSPKWRALFRHVTVEALRLRLEVNMNNDAGWNGSGGPWIRPEQSMQKVVWTEMAVAGGRRFEGTLPQPKPVAGYYRDLAVLAFPTPGAFRIDNLKAKAGFEAAYVGEVARTNLPPGMVIDRAKVVELTSEMNTEGALAWDAPAGDWTLVRFGHTSTGVENAPAPASGRGLECDKLSREGIQANFDGMMGKLIADVGPLAGRTLVATHIDSWENGAQNWTARMREEFQRRRGYDLWHFLPVLTGRVLENLDISERFLWDLRKTISELVIENYAGGLRELAHQHGMKLSIEAYGGPCEDLPYAGQADEPMCEFWMGGGAFNTVKGMASAAHTYGKPILGAEAFTAADQEKWLDHPGSIKALGDRAFCEGVNRIVFHRYAMQPWPEERRPGMTMGPWGLHYERTQTWWDWSRPWHEYLARCQFLLRQGLFVADLCYLQPEAAPQDFHAHKAPGYDYDECSADVVLNRMKVIDGRLTLPDGMSYRALVLPEVSTMTPALLHKIGDLARAGATVVGPRPSRSPSLSGYPRCDEEVNRLATELWADCDGNAIKEHSVGKGRVVWGVPPEKVLAQAGVRADFTARPRLTYIHRADANTDIYFVANPKHSDVEAICTFRVTGKRPELWAPETGRIEAVSGWEEKDGATSLPLRLGPSGSVFVVFRAATDPVDRLVAASRNGKSILPDSQPGRHIIVRKAVYGIVNDPARTRDVRREVQQIIDSGEESFQVSRLAEEEDPAPREVKSALIEYSVGDASPITVKGRDRDTLHLPDSAPKIVVHKAVYGVPGDAQRTRDVRDKLQHLLDAGEFSFSVARMAEGDDPAYMVVKTLTVECSVDGKLVTVQGSDPETISLATPPELVLERIAHFHRAPGGQLQLEAWQPGRYAMRLASGETKVLDVASLPEPLAVAGEWTVDFDRAWGGPGAVRLESLTDWSKHPEAAVKYFSGSATYRKTLALPDAFLKPGQRVYLDLGKVAVMAEVRVNGQNFGTTWKRPFIIDISQAARAGDNTLEIRVVNLWVNRLIGDEQLPEDSERNPNGTLKQWPSWLKAGQPSPTGRFTFTSWRLWKKDSVLQESGLLGPVTLRPTALLDL